MLNFVLNLFRHQFSIAQIITQVSLPIFFLDEKKQKNQFCLQEIAEQHSVSKLHALRCRVALPLATSLFLQADAKLSLNFE